MLRMLKIGSILLLISSCAAGLIKDPQPVYIINTKFMAVVKGTKNFNYKKGKKQMTAWVQKPKEIKWSEIPENLFAFPLDIWLTQIKPALRELAKKQEHKKKRR